MEINDYFRALIVNIVLTIGSFICGYAPSFINSSPEVIELIAMFGGGTIVGMTFFLVLPESIKILTESQNELNRLKTMADEEPKQASGFGLDFTTNNVNGLIGSALLIGFSTMLLIQKVSDKLSENASQQSRNNQTSDTTETYTTQKDNKLSQREHNQNFAFLTTVAMCAHSLAEGPAMGASLFLMISSGYTVGLAITIALFLHKAPESASYGTLLVHNKVPTQQKIKYILSFAVSSPLTAFLAFALLNYQSQNSNYENANNKETNQTRIFWNGFVLLIATGTLFYISFMHILPDVFEEPTRYTVDDIEDTNKTAGQEKKVSVEEGPSVNKKLVFLTLGILSVFLIPEEPQ